MMDKVNSMMMKYFAIVLMIVSLIVMYSSPEYFKVTVLQNGNVTSETCIGVSKSKSSLNDQESFVDTKDLVCGSTPLSDENFNKCEYLDRVTILYTIAVALLVISFTPGMCHVMITASVVIMIMTIDTFISFKKIQDDIFTNAKNGLGITSGDSIQVGDQTIKVEKSNGVGFAFTIVSLVLAVFALMFGFKDEMLMIKDRYY